MAHSTSSITFTRSYHQVLTRLLRHNALPQLRSVVDKTAPADIAPVLPMLSPVELRKVLALLIQPGKAASTLLELERSDLRELMASLEDAILVAICRSSAPDDAADLLDVLGDERREQVLAKLGGDEGIALEALLEQENPTAGSMMTTEYLALRDDVEVSDAIEEIRRYPRKDSFFYVYTVDADGHLVGVLDLRGLILADPAATLGSIMMPNVVRCSVETSQEDVARLVARYDLLSMPVVDSQNLLVGVVTVDDVLDVIQEEAEEDLLHLGGVAVGERVTTSAAAAFRMRLPWLAVNLVTAFFAAGVVRMFEGTIAAWAALAAFMPIVAGMGGNAGTQTLTVFVRGIALGEIDWRSGFRPIAKEVIVGLGNGAVLGLLTGIIVWFWVGDHRLAVIIFAAMVVNMVVAGFAGGVVPVLLKRLGFDPAISSSIFVTTFTDVCGFFVFLGLASAATTLF